MNMVKVEGKWISIDEVMYQQLNDYLYSSEETEDDMDGFWPFDD